MFDRVVTSTTSAVGMISTYEVLGLQVVCEMLSSATVV